MPSLRDVGAAWNLRPVTYSRPVWALMLALDRLPWPWGEEILTASFVARTFVRIGRLRQALTWAASQESSSRWRLAMALCSRHGRFVARSGPVGLRDPAALRPVLTVPGEEHLAPSRNGAIFLSCHLR